MCGNTMKKGPRMIERWAAVREFPDHYEISDQGRLRRINPYRQCHAGKIRKPQTAKSGYIMYMLSIQNVPVLRSAHRMVADAFLGPIPEGMQVNHKNGAKSDPRLDNLEVVTNSENRAHSYRTLGVAPNKGATGLKNPHATLTFDQVREIRKKYATGGESYSTLSHAYGVSKQTIARFVKNKVRTKA